MSRTLLLVAMLLPVIAWSGDDAGGRDPDVLRVCADPNNLPFSNRDEQGFENRLAEIVARELGKQGVEYTWWAQRRGFMRNTLNAGRCDVVMGLPTGSERALTTVPYYDSTYALVYRKSANYTLTSLDDPLLHKLDIGLHFIGDDYSNPPPARALAERGIVDNVVGYSIYGDYSRANPPARLIEAVAQGDIDVAVAWGPLAGYFASRQAVELVVQPLAADEGSAFEFPIALGVRKDDEALRDRLSHILAARKREIHELLERYGVPLLDNPARQASSNER